MGLGSNYAAHATAQRAQERKDAAENLAYILAEAFNAQVSAEMVRDVIRRKWFRLSTLAHYVHDEVS